MMVVVAVVDWWRWLRERTPFFHLPFYVFTEFLYSKR
jgi:hypothetical protein